MHYSLVHTACHGKSKSWEVPQEYRPPFRDLSFLRLTDGDARWTWEVDELHLIYTHSVNLYCVHRATQRASFCALPIQNRAKTSTLIVRHATQYWLKLTICASGIQDKKVLATEEQMRRMGRCDSLTQSAKGIRKGWWHPSSQQNPAYKRNRTWVSR